jgi:hypothetical protein
VRLNNETLVLLSKFATKAKKHIGIVELNKMFSSQQYANNILIKARLSHDKELAILTKIVNQELNLNAIEMNSIEAYLDTLRADGANLDYIESCKYFLIILADYLYDIPADGNSFRLAVESLVQHADIDERPLCLEMARAFYPFWMNEHKLACAMHNHAILQASTPENDSHKKSTIELWNNIDTEFFSTLESEPIDLYIASLHERGISSEQIKTKQKLAKIIIKELRSEGNDKDSYRKVIEKIQRLFTRQDLQQLSLNMSRDFYNFWISAQQSE